MIAWKDVFADLKPPVLSTPRGDVRRVMRAVPPPLRTFEITFTRGT